MQAGKLRKRVIIEKKSSGSQDNYGTVVTSWTTNKEAWAEIKPFRGSQYFAAQQTQAAVSHKIRIRYTTLANSTVITPLNSRITYGDRVFNIQSVINPDERNIYLDLMAVEEL